MCFGRRKQEVSSGFVDKRVGGKLCLHFFVQSVELEGVRLTVRVMNTFNEGFCPCSCFAISFLCHLRQVVFRIFANMNSAIPIHIQSSAYGPPLAAILMHPFVSTSTVSCCSGYHICLQTCANRQQYGHEVTLKAASN